MAASTPIPSLSEDGWVTSPAQLGDYLLSHFFVAEASQSFVYGKTVASLPGLIQQYQDDPNGLMTGVQRTLQEYFTRYAQNVVCDVSVAPDPIDATVYALNIFVSYTGTDGQTFSLGKLVNVMNTKIQKIMDANNKDVY